jgi:gluconolactonase
MIRYSAPLSLSVSFAALLACGAGGSDDGDSPSQLPSFNNPPPNGSGGTNAGSGGAGGTGPVGAAGAQGGAASAGAGNVSNGGSAQTGGGQGGSGQAGSATAGSGNAGGSDPGATAGNAGSASDPGGGFVSADVEGGASAAFVCPAGVVFGDPLAGMGAIQSVTRDGQNPGFSFIEGPVWVGSENTLFFSDNVSPARIWRISPPFTTPTVFMENSGSNGLAIDAGDQLIVADATNQRVVRLDPQTGALGEELVASGQHKPNDLVVRSDGNLYFTDPDSGGRGLYRASPGGQLSGPLLPPSAVNGPNAPNGVVLSPDENTLYVGDVQQQFVAAFDLAVDGSVELASGRVFVRTSGSTADGMAMDCAGNLYVGTNNGIEVFAPDASPIGTIPTGDSSSNATFGGPDRRTLFVTQRSTLKFVTLAVPGLPD